MLGPGDRLMGLMDTGLTDTDGLGDTLTRALGEGEALGGAWLGLTDGTAGEMLGLTDGDTLGGA